MAGEADDFLDGEVPEMTDAQLSEMRPAREVMTADEMAAVTGRGRPRAAKPKVPVTIRLDADVVEAFKATGKGWQTKINATLKRAAVSNRSLRERRVKTPAARSLNHAEPRSENAPAAKAGPRAAGPSKPNGRRGGRKDNA